MRVRIIEPIQKAQNIKKKVCAYARVSTDSESQGNSFAQEESKNVSDNIKWRMRKKFERGELIINTSRFLGYDKDEYGDLIINIAEAEIVKRIFEEYLKGKGAYYVPDHLKKNTIRNKGEVDSYYIEDNHAPIISREMWEAVQLEMERRKDFAEKYEIVKLDYAIADNPFAGRVICGSCGSTFGRKVWNSTDERLRRIIWRCNKKYAVKGEKSCESKHIDDKVLYKVFVEAFNGLVENKDYFMEKWERGLQSENVLVRYKTREFIKIIENAETIKEFDMDLFFRITEKMIVFEVNKIIVTLFDSTDIEVIIE